MRASVGKRSPEYSTRSPFLAAMGSTCKQGKPNGNLKTNGRVPHWAEDDPKSEGSPFKDQRSQKEESLGIKIAETADEGNLSD